MNNRALKFLKLLYANQGRYIKANYIEEKLQTKRRNIAYLIRKLKDLGYEVESRAGYHGGYRIIDNDLMTVNDLIELDKILKNKPDLMYKIIQLNKKVKIN